MICDNISSLGSSLIAPLALGDIASDLEENFASWSFDVIQYLQQIVANKVTDVSLQASLPPPVPSALLPIKNSGVTTLENKKLHHSGDIVGHQNGTKIKKNGNKSNNYLEVEDDVDIEEEEEDLINAQYIGLEDHNSSLHDRDLPSASSVTDVEDLGVMMKENEHTVGREMVTRLQRKALVKEGYRIIGSHSAVKLCRWTKNQLRGRGGCYKHTFYGITSYQCMEATPSLACANKCVFCWRHHKNPVGTSWRWKTDPPAFIVEEAIEQHRSMINQMRGVPGVQSARLKDAFEVRHCALSLVGEPIMYPHINEMLRQLHNRGISSFLVTNAQFPDHIRDLDPVTQLYVSVDAATEDALQAIDRPLFKDFWNRFNSSLNELAKKRQRTVYRLTLVKDWNMEQIEGYANLIMQGLPDFIEIKAVTYCGKSDASSLTMKNVPWHTEVCQYAEALALHISQLGCPVRYSIATEHEHSCCILLAREDKFKVDGIWHTWIDYPKFNELINDYYTSGGEKLFRSEDYMAVTPTWALYASTERGFDPLEARWRRTKAGAIVENSYEPSGSGCG